MIQRRIDPEIAKLQKQIEDGRFSNAMGRIADASLHLRLAMNIIADLEASPPVDEAAQAMDKAATVLLRFLDAHTKAPQ